MVFKGAFLFTLAIQALGDGGEDSGSKEIETAAVTSTEAAPNEYFGLARQLDVSNPFMLEAEVEIDGRLDDAAWAQAALL
jgi:hypothetical protein